MKIWAFTIYTNDMGSCEVDFVVDTGELIIPLEVKAEVNLRAKSLKTYSEKFSPEVYVRTAMTDYKKTRSAYKSSAVCD